MTIKPFQAFKPNLEEITSNDVFFGQVKKNYPDFHKAGFFKRMPTESLFIYQVTSDTDSHTGLVCRMPVEDYDSGKVIKHEHTLAAKEQKMLLLTLEREAMIKPVLLTYPPVKAINKFIKKHIKKQSPAYSVIFEEEGTQHDFYPIGEGQGIQKIQELFREHVPKTYVADGHHRLATSSILKKRMAKKKQATEMYDYFLCSLFPTSELDIHEYNRLVTFDHSSPTFVIAMLSRKFNIELIESPRLPKKKHELILALGEEWFSLQWRSKILKKYKSTLDGLDVQLLNEEVLSQIFEVENISTDKRVKYVSGTLGVEGIREKVTANNNLAGFILPPVSWDEFLEITDAGITLPPKSTWFEPRMKNGLIGYGY